MGIDWNKVGSMIQMGIEKGSEMMEKKQKEIISSSKNILRKKTDDELLRIYNNTNLNNLQRQLVEQEMSRRGML